ncbi:hypothetical protein R69888_02476 [Paraburkholderia haematera]|jgi:Predicted small secreted protein|uniref:Uncharacterized protein n=1 Tax=Paraburkholderia haematera TaxID=2793077 RepID=A0ABM8R970_9BURK|nr:hypothetical protein R69888_02476 [Paraburkholderia haematera]
MAASVRFEPQALCKPDAIAGPLLAYNASHASMVYAAVSDESAALMLIWYRHRCRRQQLLRGANMTRLIALILIAGTALLAGCNTIAGAGEDISKGGQAIHNSAEEAK